MSMEAPLLLALQQAPALLIFCKKNRCLKQLRAVSRTSRRLATSAITTFKVLSGNAAQQADLLRMMRDCKLTKVQLVAAEIGAALYGDHCFPSASGIMLIRSTRRLAKAMGPALGSVTHLELWCTHQPYVSSSSSSSSSSSNSSSSSRQLLAKDSASIARTFSLLCPALTRLTVHMRLELSRGQTTPQHQKLRLADFLRSSGTAVISRLTHLQVDAYAQERSTANTNIFLPLNNTDMACIGSCTSLTHLDLWTSITHDVNWDDLPVTLESMCLQTIDHGPRPGTSIPLKLVKLREDCIAGVLVLLLRSCPSIKAVHLRDLIAHTSPESVASLRIIQEFNESRDTTCLSDTCGMLVNARSGASVGHRRSNDTAVALTRVHSPVVRAQRIKLLTLEAEGPSFANFLQQMRPMPGYAFCYIARPMTAVLPVALQGVDPFLSQLERVFPDLRSLLVNRCSLLDADLATLSQCKHLQAVHLGGCAGLSRAGVLNTARKSGKLLVLEAHGCRGVSLMAQFKVEDTLEGRRVGSKKMELAALLKVQNSDTCRVYFRELFWTRHAVLVIAVGLCCCKRWVEKRVVRFVAVRVLPFPKARVLQLVDSGFWLHDGVIFARFVTGR